jgi:putative ABC transport system permease protein
MISLLLDLRHAVRVLVKNLAATAPAVFTLALVIGATTAIFSVVYGVLLRPLPYPAPDWLMAVWEVNHRGTYSRLADPNFDDFRDRNHTFSAMAKYADGVTSVAGTAEPTRATVAAVTRDFFKVLGIQPSLGRGLTAEDARIGAEPVVVVSHRYWVQSLGSAEIFSGFHIRIEDRVYTVVGVMPAGFQFPAKADLWLPAELDAENTSRTSHNYSAIGRLRDGVSVAQASADLSGIAKDIIRRSAEQGDYLLADAAAVPLQSSITRRVGSTLYVLLGAVFFLLLVACANVTNLLLAQAAARQRELAIRHALGAGRGRLVRQFVAEALVLLTISCLGGLLIASLGTSALLSLAPADLPRLDDVSMNWAVLTFAMGLSALVAIGLGLFTALRAARRDPRDSLVDGARGQTGGATSQRVGRIVVAAQMAMTVVLLVGAGLLGRSLLRVLSVDPGFRTDGIVAMDLAMPYSDDPAAKARLFPFYADVFGRLRAIPGVEEVAAANAVPMDGGLPDGLFLEVAPKDVPKTMAELKTLYQQKDKLGTADYCAVSPAYFRALGIPLVRGRLFEERDGSSAPHVALISESLARSRWKNADPIGATIEFGNMDGDLRPLTVVGIVGDTREYGLEQPARPTLYVNLMQRPKFSVTVVMRSSADPRAIASGARDILKEVAPDVPPRFRTFEQIYSASLGARHFNLTLVGVFAGTALILAIAGIYGVMTYSVTQRRREIGVRIALGASRRQVFRIVVGQGLMTTAIGVTIGILVALGLTRTIESLLFDVTPNDPVTFAAVVAVLTSVAIAACYLPARRATDVDPVEALRQE